MSFAEAATRAAGLAGLLLGWHPREFWDATPAELAAVLAAADETGGGERPAGRADIDRLKEMFPDG